MRVVSRRAWLISETPAGFASVGGVSLGRADRQLCAAAASVEADLDPHSAFHPAATLRHG
jgi:hypothetical protein